MHNQSKLFLTNFIAFISLGLCGIYLQPSCSASHTADTRLFIPYDDIESREINRTRLSDDVRLCVYVWRIVTYVLVSRTYVRRARRFVISTLPLIDVTVRSTDDDDGVGSFSLIGGRYLEIHTRPDVVDGSPVTWRPKSRRNDSFARSWFPQIPVVSALGWCRRETTPEPRTRSQRNEKRRWTAIYFL